MIDQIEQIMKKDKETFCEFLTCLYNKGLAHIICEYKDDNNFWFRRVNEQFGINDMFVCCDDIDYFDKIISSFDGFVLTAIMPFDISEAQIQDNWKISKRRQFCKSKADSDSCDAVRLDASYKPLIQTSASETTKENFSLAIEYDEPCFGFFKDELCCFASVSEIKKTDITEINWIHTEPKCRNKGYASVLLRDVSNLYATKGILVTYHCDSENIASAKTALKSGFKEVAKEIVLEKRL